MIDTLQMRRGGRPAAFSVALMVCVALTASCPAARGDGARPDFIAMAGFEVREIAGLAPGQPYDAFFGECPSLAHRGGTTWFVYADDAFDIFINSYDHDSQVLSVPVMIGAGWNDHLRPALVIGDDGDLHVLYAARPMPLRYHRSSAPLDHTAWSAHEQVGTSATYPVPHIFGGRLLVIYREGDSYSASLSCAARDLGVPIGAPGAWTVTRIVEESSVFVPMPLAAFELGGRVCFLFNMRDALLSSPHTPVAPSVREGMAVVCTVDGASFTGIDGSPLSLPLDYTEDREGFPEVTSREEYADTALGTGNERAATGALGYDGSFVELALTPAAYTRTEILVGDSAGCSCRIELTPAGQVLLSDGDAAASVSTYRPGETCSLRLKFHFSAGCYRPWLDGALAGDPLDLTIADPPPAGALSIDSVAVLESGGCRVRLLAGREYKLITASAVPDAGGELHCFFIDRMDSSKLSRWRLMHQHGGQAVQIGDPTCHQYQPSSIRLGGLFLVAVAYFEGDGLFLDNEHLTASSRIMLLANAGGESWEESEIAAGPAGHVHPIFKRDDGSGLIELIWAMMESGSSTVLMHGAAASPSDLFPGQAGDFFLCGMPNPFSSSATIRFVLETPRAVDMEIYDCAGRLLRRLLAGKRLEAGTHDIPWDGCGDDGAPVSPGVYFVRAGAGAVSRSTKIVLMR